MKQSLSILTAAAVTIAALIRRVTESQVFTPGNESVCVPEINAPDVGKYALNGATDQEIADCFLVDVSLVREQYGHIVQCNRARHKIALRGLQLQAARKLAPSVLIFLGKNDLGQSNSPGAKGEAMPELDEDE